jgi:glyceraldehyde-3-phosphate dehydrogenase/erythrose-4-phosphate dehydrogenase
MPNKKIVHVIGTGTIGEPLTGLLVAMQEQLGVDEVTFHKRTPLMTDRSKVLELKRRGARLAVNEDSMDSFKEMGIIPDYDAMEALERSTVVIDCTPVGNQNKVELYDNFKKNTMGFIAQGSEFGFGKPYARGINDKALKHGEDQFLQVVSCNTHNLAVLIDNIALADGGPDNLVEARFLCLRRANDLSQDGSFCPSPQAGKHKDERFGTHHARDVWHLFNTMNVDLKNIFSSAMKTNTQYMHCIQFNLRLKRKVTVDEVLRRLRANDRVALTWKMSANSIFSFGRDYGHYGRILSQTVVVVPSLIVREGTEVVGFCFTPQDGNPLLSSVAAATWFMYPKTYEEKIQCMKPYFFPEV